jgi:ribonuclease R
MIKKILELLKKNKQGLNFQRIARELNLLQREKPLLKKRLYALENKGAILKAQRKYFILPESRLIRGKLVSIGRGYGFVRQEKDPSRDIFIPGRHSGGALLGDIVEVVCQEKGTGEKLEGKIVRIVKKDRKTVIGIFKERWGQPFVLPYEAPSFDEIPVKCRTDIKVEPNVVVEVDRDTWCIKKALGKPETPGVDIKVVSAKFELSDSFSAEALTEAKEISSHITLQEREGRRDFRSWRTVTIDGEDARDFDDAVSIKKLKNGNLLLGVHIADVSFYIKPDSFLDRDAYLKGTSVYFPETTFPMLPERLSADICSLREGEERLAFSVLLEINKRSEVVKSDFLPSIIKSDARMTYNSVYKIFSGEEKEINKYSSFVPDLMHMRELADRLREKRVKEGSLDFEHPEPQLVYKGKVLSGVTPLEQNEAHRVIEVFMVAANESVAVFLANKKAPALFRVHPPPALADLEKLRSILSHFGLSCPSSDKIRGNDLQSILERAAGRHLTKTSRRKKHFQL